jgi:hypothetical protein
MAGTSSTYWVPVLAVPLALGFAAASHSRTGTSPGETSESSFFVIALLIWAKVYLKNDSVDHTRLATDSGLGRPTSSRSQ